MNLNAIINEIEELTSATERCISYAEVILYLKAVRETYGFYNSTVDWKNDINQRLVNHMQAVIDEQIEQIKLLIDLNIKQK